MIEIAIKIPDDIYEQAINGTEYDTLSLGIKLRQSVQEGVVIPKGHGRLIDADELFLDIQTDEQMRLGENLEWVREKIEDAPTIIEADTESEEEE